MPAPTYSFVIPAYNDAEGLQRHLDYFRTRPELIQLLIVDDGSTDETETVMSAADLPDNIALVYHRQAENGGPAAARNTGMDLAEGTYLTFLDADDILAACFFDYVALSPLQNGADLVLFKYHLSTDPDQRYTYDMHRIDNAFFTGIEGIELPTQTYRLADLPGVLSTVAFPWNKVYRRAFLKESNIRFPDLRMHEDILPHWHSFLRAERFGVLSWAPPLITHYEAVGERATGYIGERRMGVFDSLTELHDELDSHDLSGALLPQFDSFCQDMFGWMTGPLCAGRGQEGQLWRRRYRAAIQQFGETIDREVSA